MKNKNYSFLVIIIIFAGFLLGGLIFFRYSDTSDSKDSLEMPQAPSAIEKIETSEAMEDNDDGMVAASQGPILETPLVSEDIPEVEKEAIAEMKERIQAGQHISRTVNGTSILFYHTKEKNPNHPMVEFRFLKLNNDGEEEKVFVTSTEFNRRQNKKSFYVSDEKKGFSGNFAQQSIPHSFRLLAGPPESDNYLMIRFGRRYHIIFTVVDKETGDKKNMQALLRFPTIFLRAKWR